MSDWCKCIFHISPRNTDPCPKHGYRYTDGVVFPPMTAHEIKITKISIWVFYSLAFVFGVSAAIVGFYTGVYNGIAIILAIVSMLLILCGFGTQDELHSDGKKQ